MEPLNQPTTILPTTEFDDLNIQDQIMGFTENNSATFLSTSNPCLDFFFHIVPDSDQQTIEQRLNLSWSHDPLKTLKLIANLRGVRGTGKSDKENFYISALWLFKNHPKSLSCNLETFAKFGYFKDLPEILFRILEGCEVRRERKEEWREGKRGKGKYRKSYFIGKRREKKEKSGDVKEIEEKRRLRGLDRETRVLANAVKVKEEMEKARKLRRERDEERANRVEEKCVLDGDFKFLYESVVSLFAKMLKSDLDALKGGDLGRISLAAKWCPNVDSSYDKVTLLCKGISKVMFPREEYGNDSEEQYVVKVRNRLRKEVLVPLHEALKLPEVYMSAKQWGSVLYERVPSVAMRNYTDVFLHRDNGRFREYLENVKVGKSKIAAGALLPHEIIQKNSKGSSGASLVSELQWKRMVDDLSSKGKLSNCIAVSDVSGSMYGTPMEVSIALGLLISEVSEEPWKGHVITFSENPVLHTIKPGNLRSKIESVRNMDWGGNTDFQRVFDRILDVAVNGNLSEDQMIKRVFVFSDMEFDEANPGTEWETDYMVIQRKFKEKGFPNVPEIVFWNLRDSAATPVTATQNGVALVSGFSKNLLTLFLEEGGAIKPEDASGLVGDEKEEPESKGEMNPETTMEAAIAGELYEELVVYD